MAAHIRSCSCKLVLGHVKNYPKILMNWVIKVKIKSSSICLSVAGFFVSVWFFTLIYTSFFSVCLLLLVANIQEHDPSQKHFAEQTEVPRNLYLQEIFSGTVGTAYRLQPEYFCFVSLVSLCCSLFCDSNFVEKKKQDNLSRRGTM